MLKDSDAPIGKLLQVWSVDPIRAPREQIINLLPLRGILIEPSYQVLREPFVFRAIHRIYQLYRSGMRIFSVRWPQIYSKLIKLRCGRLLKAR